MITEEQLARWERLPHWQEYLAVNLPSDTPAHVRVQACMELEGEVHREALAALSLLCAEVRRLIVLTLPARPPTPEEPAER
jgi:hypothetical protein